MLSTGIDFHFLVVLGTLVISLGQISSFFLFVEYSTSLRIFWFKFYCCRSSEKKTWSFGLDVNMLSNVWQYRMSNMHVVYSTYH